MFYKKEKWYKFGECCIDLTLVSLVPVPKNRFKVFNLLIYDVKKETMLM